MVNHPGCCTSLRSSKRCLLKGRRSCRKPTRPTRPSWGMLHMTPREVTSKTPGPPCLQTWLTFIDLVTHIWWQPWIRRILPAYQSYQNLLTKVEAIPWRLTKMNIGEARFGCHVGRCGKARRHWAPVLLSSLCCSTGSGGRIWNQCLRIWAICLYSSNETLYIYICKYTYIHTYAYMMHASIVLMILVWDYSLCYEPATKSGSSAHITWPIKCKNKVQQ